jgi:hypothetical protein
MEYTYKIESLQPKAEYMRVRYSAEGHEDYVRSFNPRQYDQEHLIEIITGFASTVVETWERLAAHPEIVDVATEGVATAEAPNIAGPDFDPLHAPVIEDQPAFDQFTQYITLNEIEDPMQPTVGWTVHDMTAEEQADFLANWRAFFAVTMRQARLALSQQGLLATVEDAIALIPEPDKTAVSIEWEYAAIVERGSSWVATMASALGLNDEQMDDLFKLAATL